MKIAEVSERSGLSINTLRYYERVGLIPPVDRNDSGMRDYTDLDIQRVEFIECMRGAGLPSEVLIDYLELVQQGDRQPGSLGLARPQSALHAGGDQGQSGSD
jgi:DNA-binding transcriptional MerR regulator